MVFYYFGPDPSSWAFGNDYFALANNLPQSIQAVWDQLGEPFDDKKMAGTRIEWMSSAPDGTYAIMTKDGNLLSNNNDMLNTVIQQVKLIPGTAVQHVCFSPLGGWFIRYADRTVQISGVFPDTFIKAVESYIQLTGPAANARQFSSIEGIWFGNDNSFVARVGTSLIWQGVSDALATLLRGLIDGTLTFQVRYLGPSTVLCPWSTDYYFIEALSSLYRGRSTYPFELSSDQAGFMTNVVTNTYPSAQLLSLASNYGTSAQTPSQPSLSRNEPTSGKPNTSVLIPSEVPENMRRCYEQQFNTHTQGEMFMSEFNIGQIISQRGVPSQILPEIWKSVRKERVTRLDKEEFIQFMWQMDTRLTGANTKIRWLVNAIECDGCDRGLVVGEDTYFCALCSGGDLDLCQSCYAHSAKRCQHQMSSVTIQLPQGVKIRQFPGDYVVCDGCGSRLVTGDFVYCCEHCNNGDNDLCEDCWGAGRRQCKHVMWFNKLQAENVSAQPPSQVVEQPSQPLSTPYGKREINDDLPSSNYTPATTSNTGPKFADETPSDIDKLSKKFQDSSLKDSLMNSIISEKPDVKWNDVSGLEAAKAGLQEAVIFPLRFPHLFGGKRRLRRAHLLYGPPGTGKSYLAKAVATEAGCPLFILNIDDVMSKWMSEGPNLIRKIFVLAREKKPSIIFIDEIETLCSKQDSNSANTETIPLMKTEFLVQIDDLGNKNDGIFVLAATNSPWSLDPPLRKRFQKRFHIPLPNEEAREMLFRVQIGDMASSLGNTDIAFKHLARMTEGFSGTDIGDLIQDALMIPVQKIHTATYFRKSHDREGEWYTPCTASDFGATSMRWNHVPARQLKETPLSIEDLLEAAKEAKPSVREDEVRKCREWTQLHGTEGA